MSDSCLQNCLDCLKWLPVILIIGILGWSYYAYVAVLCIDYIPDLVTRILYLVFYHIILFTFIFSYVRTICQPYQHVPSEFRLSSDELVEYLEKSTVPKASGEYLREIVKKRKLPIYTFDAQGFPRYCLACYSIKPDRAHHCSTCRMCHMRMDHHCPWVSTCIAHHNYKFFVHFLLHGTILSIYVAATTGPFFVKYWKTTQWNQPMYLVNIIILFFVACVFIISLGVFSIYHLYLIAVNQTTLEASRPPNVGPDCKPDHKAFNLGVSENFREVFGNNPLGWFIPIGPSRSNGVHWLMRGATQGNGYEAL